MKTGLFKKLENLEDLMVAVTFAEKNQQAYALELLGGKNKSARLGRAKTKRSRIEPNQPQMRL